MGRLAFMWDVYGIGFRAGLWRRNLALLIDVFVVMLPYQVLAISLLVATAGAVQIELPISFNQECHKVGQPYQQLDPPPPEQPNFTIECKSSIFRVDASRNLIIFPSGEGPMTNRLPQIYNLDADVHPRRATLFAINWLSNLALLTYLVTMEHRTGATLGQRVMRISVVSWKAPGERGIPLIDALVRHLGAGLGIVPLIALELYQYITGDNMNASSTIAGFSVSWNLIAFLSSYLWYFSNLFLIVTKRDPLYDRLARASVLRD
jgi:hypothetical protein